MNKGIAVRQTDRTKESGRRGDRGRDTGREVSSTEGGWGVGGSKRGERLCWWRLCVWAHVCL